MIKRLCLSCALLSQNGLAKVNDSMHPDFHQYFVKAKLFKCVLSYLNLEELQGSLFCMPASWTACWLFWCAAGTGLHWQLLGLWRNTEPFQAGTAGGLCCKPPAGSDGNRLGYCSDNECAPYGAVICWCFQYQFVEVYLTRQGDRQYLLYPVYSHCCRYQGILGCYESPWASFNLSYGGGGINMPLISSLVVLVQLSLVFWPVGIYYW